MFNQVMTAIGGLLLIASSHVAAISQTAHVHGEARGSIIIGESSATVKITIPAMSVVGFEHRPTTPAEKQQVEATKKAIKATDVLIFYTTSRWLRSPKKINATAIKFKAEFVVGSSKDIDDHDDAHDDHHERHHHHDHKADNEDQHADLVLSAKYSLESPIRAISSNIFSVFPEVHQLTLDIVSDHVQHQVTLSSHTQKGAIPNPKIK